MLAEAFSVMLRKILNKKIAILALISTLMLILTYTQNLTQILHNFK